MKGLRVHGLAARFAVTTLLLMLLMAGVEPNPGPTFTTSEENHVTDRTTNASDSGNLIDTANGTANNNSQQLFDLLFAAINQLALTVSELGDKVGHFEHSQNEKSSRIDQRLGVMEKAINTRLIDVEENQNVLRIDMDAMDYEFAKMTDSFEHMQKKADVLEAKVELLDTQSRRNNLLFFGIPRVFGETWDLCEAKVREIIGQDMKVRQPVQIDRAQRVGSAILVQFQSFKQREDVLSHSRELRATESPIYVREDFSEAVRRKRSGLTPLLKQFHDDGKRAKLRHDRLVTEDGTFTFDLKRQEYQRVEPRIRPAATTRYHKDWQRRTDNRFHSSTDADSLPPRSVDNHNHGGTDRRFLRAASRGRRPDGRLFRNDSCPRPDNRHSLPNAQYTSSDNNDSAQVLRRDSGLRQHYSQRHTSGNVLSTRQDRQHHNNYSSSNDWKTTRRTTLHVWSRFNRAVITPFTPS